MDALPFTPFEELMFWEDRPSFPYSVFSRFRFTGRLDRDAVAAALSQSISRHPLLSSKAECRGRRWYWMPDQPQAALTWQEVPEDPAGDFPRTSSIDLRTEIGVRAFVTVGPRISDLVIQFHHSCCDGAGLFAFIDDFLILYARERGATAVPLPNYDVGRLAGRGRFGLTWWKLLKMFPRQLIGLQGAAQFVGRQPVPLVPHLPRHVDSPPPDQFPSVLRHDFTADATRQLRKSAQQRDVSVNDMLARDLFLAIIRWRHEQGIKNDHDWLRMMVPMNLRTSDDRELPAANVVGLVFLDRRGVDAADPDRLLDSIHDEMALIKRNQLGLTFLFSLVIARQLPGGIRKMVATDKCTMSCVLSNVGKLFHQSPLPRRNGQLVAGDVCLESFQGLVPLRPHNCLSVTVQQYADQLAVDMHFDSGVLTPSQAGRMMQLFIERTHASSCLSSP